MFTALRGRRCASLCLSLCASHQAGARYASRDSHANSTFPEGLEARLRSAVATNATSSVNCGKFDPFVGCSIKAAVLCTLLALYSMLEPHLLQRSRVSLPCIGRHVAGLRVLLLAVLRRLSSTPLKPCGDLRISSHSCAHCAGDACSSAAPSKLNPKANTSSACSTPDCIACGCLVLRVVAPSSSLAAGLVPKGSPPASLPGDVVAFCFAACLGLVAHATASGRAPCLIEPTEVTSQRAAAARQSLNNDHCSDALVLLTQDSTRLGTANLRTKYSKP
mmetsp:Transcript_34590/g.79099  ORF Transcript_34590/g.79099 Transcript_34590/m.79099 type:complete len:277 (+) Transcript_34590:97-927(+)